MKRYFVPAAVILAWGSQCTMASEQAPLTLMTTIAMPDVPLGPYQDHLAVDISRNRLFTTPQAAKSVQVFDIGTGKLISTIHGFGNPHYLLYRSDLDRLYVTDGGSGLLKIFNGNCREIGSIKLLLGADASGYDPTTGYLYVVNGGRHENQEYEYISVLDTAALTRLGDIRLNSKSLEAMALESKGPRIYVNMADKNAIAVLDRKSLSLVATWPLTKGTDNVSIGLDEENHRLFVGCRNSGKDGAIIVIDTTTGKELATLAIGGFVDYITFDPSSKRIYASCGGDSGSVFVYKQNEAGNYDLMGHVTTAPGAKTALLVPELSRLFVAVPHNEKTEAKIIIFQVAR